MIKFCLLCVVLFIVFGCVPCLCPAAAEDCRIITTQVTPHMDVPITPGRNILFCSTFHITWNEMREGIIHEDIRLEKPLELVDRLNRGRMTRADIADEDYLSMAGYGADGIADRINAALRDKFGDGAPVVDDIYNDDDVILAYAFLWKELQFEHAFEDFLNPIHFEADGRRSPVEAFGVFKYSDDRHRHLRGQVEIIEYDHGREFIVALASKRPDDEIILANVEAGGTLRDTYEQVNRRVARSRRAGTGERLRNNDVLQIPKFDVSMNHSYSSLLGLHLLNRGFEEYFVAEARQDVQFRLDECGAAVKSEAVLALKKGPPVDFKILRFDNPFLLYLKKKGAEYPYFAIWVENPALMVKSN